MFIPSDAIETSNHSHLLYLSGTVLELPHTGCTAIHSLCDMEDCDMFGSNHIDVEDDDEVYGNHLGLPVVL